MSNGDTQQLNSCGCCQGEPSLNTISNRPGLSAIAYRLGDYGVFFHRRLWTNFNSCNPVRRSNCGGR